MKLVKLLFVLVFAVAFAACQSAQQASTPQATPAAPQQPKETPVQMLGRLHAAVQSKNNAEIKEMMSSTTRQFAEGRAEMVKQPLEEILKNGFLEMNLSPTLPAMRDVRIQDQFAAVEVQSPNGTWQDVPLVNENGSWKVAVGDIFANTYKSPGRPASAANANTNTPQVLPNNPGIPANPPALPNAANTNTAKPKSPMDKMPEKK
jgi:hypothetical protein